MGVGRVAVTNQRIATATVLAGLTVFTVGAGLTWPPLLLIAGAGMVTFGLVGIDVDDRRGG